MKFCFVIGFVGVTLHSWKNEVSFKKKEVIIRKSFIAHLKKPRKISNRIYIICAFVH